MLVATVTMKSHPPKPFYLIIYITIEWSKFHFFFKTPDCKGKKASSLQFNLSFVTDILGKRFFSFLKAFFADVPSSFIDIVNYCIRL